MITALLALALGKTLLRIFPPAPRTHIYIGGGEGFVVYATSTDVAAAWTLAYHTHQFIRLYGVTRRAALNPRAMIMAEQLSD